MWFDKYKLISITFILEWLCIESPYISHNNVAALNTAAVYLCLNGGKISLHTAQSALQCHHTCKVVTKLVCRLDHLGLLMDPAL